jgi:RNA polymerase sigma-70 factor, ECF subfamily
VAASTHFPRLVNPQALELHSDRSYRAKPDATTREQLVVLELDEVYREHFAFVWRSAKRLGVRDGSVDDVVQEVFVIVHRRLGDFEGRSALSTWLFGITLRVVRDHKRSAARRNTNEGPNGPIDPDSLRTSSPGPGESMEKAEAIRLLHTLLDEMDDERREVFVMAELEQMPMPEIAAATGTNVNTCYARLRAARQSFEASLARHRAREQFHAVPQPPHQQQQQDPHRNSNRSVK